MVKYLLFIFGLACTVLGQSTLTVTDYGVVGDAIRTSAITTASSTAVTLGSEAVAHPPVSGQLILIFCAGAPTAGTNAQDLITTVFSVSDLTNVTLTAAAGAAATNFCIYGTQNAVAFQNCFNACTNTNTIVSVPAGTYLMVPPSVLDPGATMANADIVYSCITNRGGGITLQGASAANTILLGNGAWNLKGSYVQRGAILDCYGPITNNTCPLVISNLTFDGGVSQGNLTNATYPANTTTGLGWDVTHCAVLVTGTSMHHSSLQLVNCNLVHWRGEMVKAIGSISGADPGVYAVTNCVFNDGDGSGYNYGGFSHVITGCTFTNMGFAMEFYLGTYMLSPSYFSNNTIINSSSGIVLNGGVTNSGYTSPGYWVVGNHFLNLTKDIQLGPACNVTISGNTFSNASTVYGQAGVRTDSSAYQGNDHNHDIAITSNAFVNVYSPISFAGTTVDRIENVAVNGNTAFGAAYFAASYGWCSNVTFTANTSSSPYLYYGELSSINKISRQ